MHKVELDYEEWQKVMAILAQAPWNIANPLLMKMGEQLRGQVPKVSTFEFFKKQQTNSGETPAAQGENEPSKSH